MKKILKYKIKLLLVIFSSVTLSSCEEYLEIPLPTNSISVESAFNNLSVIDGLMNQLHITLFNIVTTTTAAPMAEALSDNAYNPTSTAYIPVQTNNITSTSNLFYSWDAMYRAIYMANVLLEGLPGANAIGLTQTIKDSYIGAALTVRSIAYFQLVRCWGDAPLVLTTNVEKNKLMGRTPKAEIFTQIETDLKKAITLLPATLGTQYYINNKYIPESILANVYLTEGKWTEAEASATTVISSGKFQLVDIADVFLQNSAETIMATGYTLYFSDKALKAAFPGGYNTLPAGSGKISMENSMASLSVSLLNSFEPGDLRRTNWTVTSNSGGYSNPLNRVFAYKYKYNYVYDPLVIIPAGREDNHKFIRLAELYLIRAEARASKSTPDLIGSAADLNMIRNRAGLSNTTATSKTELIEAVIKERRVELFYENCTRWFDLIRINKADEVYSAISYKAANWKPYMKLFPIPINEIKFNPNLQQNPGY